MVGTAQPLCLSALGTDGRRYENTMNLRKKKTHSVSSHYWGWTARPFPLRFAVAGEVFALTSLFIERDYRNLARKHRVTLLVQFLKRKLYSIDAQTRVSAIEWQRVHLRQRECGAIFAPIIHCMIRIFP